MVKLFEKIDTLNTDECAKLMAHIKKEPFNVQSTTSTYYGICDYKYSGSTQRAKEFPEYLTELANKLETGENLSKGYFNMCLINKYLPNKGLGRHRDNEPEIAQESSIASVSLGATRVFSITKGYRTPHLNIPLNNGDVVMMRGNSQIDYYHAVIPAPGIRYNLTFRHHEPIKTYTPERVTSLKDNEIFVFGSNTQGRHGKGAAKQALVSFGAIYGVSEGIQGNSYAIVTKDLTSRSLYPLELISQGIKKLYQYAEEHTDKTFLITKLGCGLGGHTIQDISTQFRKLTPPDNIVLPVEFSVTTLKTTKRDSMKVQVVNKYKELDHIYCGRGSALGNPFPITATMTRDAVCDAYQEWFDSKVACNDKDVMEQLDRIKTHVLNHGYVNLGCFCAPKRCHCDTIKAYILGSIANATCLSSKTYAGIGSRSTPSNILSLMSRVGIRLEQLGYTLYSGGAEGTDKAFVQDVVNKSTYITYMHQILGDDLNSPVDFVICWTADGAETSTSYSTGGTGQAIRLAIDRGIPVFNMANKDSLTRLATLLGDS